MFFCALCQSRGEKKVSSVNACVVCVRVRASARDACVTARRRREANMRARAGKEYVQVHASVRTQRILRSIRIRSS